MVSDRRFDGADAESVLEHAQLLEAFGPLERRRRQRGERAAGTRAGRRTGPMCFQNVGVRLARPRERNRRRG